MIHKMVPEVVRKTGEQGGYEAVKRGQRKILGKTAYAMCQCQQVYTQVNERDCSISKALPPKLACFPMGKELSYSAKAFSGLVFS
jgi:hypothetical protein